MNNKTKIICLVVLALSACQTVFATSCRPFYVGAELGGCDLHYKKSDLSKDACSVDDTGFAGRLLAGFDINQNIALELGYTKYQNSKFKYSYGASTDFSQQSADFLTKVSLPVSCNVSIFAKAGLSYVMRGDAKIVRNNVTTQVNDEDDHLRPMLGVGMSYGFNSKVAVNMGYYRTFGTNDLEDADFYGAGLSFRLG